VAKFLHLHIDHEVVQDLPKRWRWRLRWFFVFALRHSSRVAKAAARRATLAHVTPAVPTARNVATGAAERRGFDIITVAMQKRADSRSIFWKFKLKKSYKPHLSVQVVGQMGTGTTTLCGARIVGIQGSARRVPPSAPPVNE
jgi:hypothetical protein